MDVTTTVPRPVPNQVRALAANAVLKAADLDLADLDLLESTLRNSPYQFLVARSTAPLFYGLARGFLRDRVRAKALPPTAEWRWRLPADDANWARAAALPVVLFLFDSTAEAGRYLRLDTLPEPPADADTVTLRLPVENAITRDSVRRLIDGFPAGRG